MSSGGLRARPPRCRAAGVRDRGRRVRYRRCDQAAQANGREFVADSLRWPRQRCAFLMARLAS